MTESNEIAETVTRTLAARELTLGTIECGTDGAVSRRIFDTAEGAAVLGDSLILDTPEQVIAALELPRPQLKKAGAFSAKAARAAAREGRALLGVHLCLAVWAAPILSGDVDEPFPVHLALNTGREVIDRSFSYQGPEKEALEWLAERALEMVQRAL